MMNHKKINSLELGKTKNYKIKINKLVNTESEAL